MSKSQKRDLYKIIAAAILLVAAVRIPAEGWTRLAVFLVPYLVIGGSVLWKAARNSAHGQIFDENFLMALATVGALIIGTISNGLDILNVSSYWQQIVKGLIILVAVLIDRKGAR